MAERAAKFMADSQRMYESTSSLSDLAGVEDTDARRREVATFGRRSSTTVVRGDGPPPTPLEGCGAGCSARS